MELHHAPVTFGLILLITGLHLAEISKCVNCVIPPECYQMVVVGQNFLTGLPFRARVGSISRTAARE